MHLRAALVALAASALAACAGPGHGPDEVPARSAPEPAPAAAPAPALTAATTESPGPQPTSAEAVATRRWSGRFAATRRPPEGSDENAARAQVASGSFVLERDGDTLRLDVGTPLGAQVARLEVDARGARLRLADGRSAEAADATALTREALGVPVPLERLPEWLAGRLDRVDVRDGADRPRSGEAAGWAIDLDDWREDGSPGRLGARGRDPATGDRLELRVVRER